VLHRESESTEKKPPSVLIVEDTYSSQRTLEEACQQNGWVIVGKAKNRKEARSLLTKKPDIVVVDIWLPPDVQKPEATDPDEGLGLLDDLAQERSNRAMTIIVISQYTVEESSFRKVAAIPASFLVKQRSEQPDVLASALALAARDFIIFDRPAARFLPAVLSRKPSFFELTPAEAEVCEDLANGLNPKQIAEKRNCAEKTVHTHIKNAKEKWGIEQSGHTALIYEFNRRKQTLKGKTSASGTE